MKEWIPEEPLADHLHRQHGLPINPRYYNQQTYVQGA